jgi:tetratricopeptide (TPR) repeat protein
MIVKRTSRNHTGCFTTSCNFAQDFSGDVIKPPRQVSISQRTLSVSLVLCACQLLLVCGCATFNPASPSNEDVTVQLQERKQETARRFEQNRDFAEFQTALAAWERNDISGCEENLARLLKRNGDHCDGLLLMADVCLAQERPQVALDHAHRAVVAHPDDARAKYALALLLDSLGESQTALAYYEQAAAAEPENEIFVTGYHSAASAAETSATRVVTISRDTDGRDTTLPNAVELADFRAEVFNGTGFAGSNDKLSSDTADDFIARGAAALQRGAVGEARKYFREAAVSEPDNPNIPVNSAIAALRLNQPSLAIEILQSAAGIFQGSARIHRILGVAQYRLGDYKSSQVALQQALSLDKSSALSYFLMGCTLAKLGETESADAHFGQAQAMHSRYAIRR